MKVLLLDIETSPDLAWVWDAWQTNVIDVERHWEILSWSAKWLDERGRITRAMVDYKGYEAPGSDLNLCKELWPLLDEADQVIAHNGADFDIRKINTRFIFHKMLPPSPYKICDTKREVKRVARFSRNGLDPLCDQLELGRKRKHEGIALWLACIKGDQKAWAKMKSYNAQDVKLLEDLYRRLSPWIRQVNATVYGERCVNPACGSSRLQSRGLVRSNSRVYRRFQCQGCGAWSRSVKSEKTGVERVPA